MAVAMRPDLHQAPIMRKSMSEIGYAGDALSAPGAGMAAGAATPDSGHTFADATAGAGEPLPFRAHMEHAFGEDLSGVRVHTGESAAMTSLQAHAAAQGDTIAFASRTPDMNQVAHVVQQRRAGGGGVHARATVSAPDDAAEREADAVAPRVVAGERVHVSAQPAAGIHRKVTEQEIVDLAAQKKTEFTEFRRWFLGKLVGEGKQYPSAEELYEQSEPSLFQQLLEEYDQPRELVARMPQLSRHQLYQEMARGVTDFEQYAVARYEERGPELLGELARLGAEYPQLLVDPGLMSPTHFPGFITFVGQVRAALETFDPQKETGAEDPSQAAAGLDPALLRELATRGGPPSPWDMRAAFSKKLGTVTVYRGLKLNEQARKNIMEQGMSPRVHRELDNRDEVLPPFGEMRDKSYYDVARDRVSPIARKSERLPPDSRRVKKWEDSQKPAPTAPGRSAPGARPVGKPTASAVKRPVARPGASKTPVTPAPGQSGQPAAPARDRTMASFSRDVARMGPKPYDKQRALVERNNDREEATQSVSRIKEVSVAVSSDTNFSGQQKDDQKLYLVELTVPALDVIDPLDYRNQDATERGLFPESARLTSPEGHRQDVAYSSEVESLIMGTIAPEEVTAISEWNGGQWTSSLDALRDEQDRAQQELETAEKQQKSLPARVAERERELKELEEKRAAAELQLQALKRDTPATSPEASERVTAIEGELESLANQIAVAKEYLRQDQDDLDSTQRRITEHRLTIAEIETRRRALREGGAARPGNMN
jgi:hypothetical protein